MPTDYNHGNVARQYQQAKLQPWRERIEKFSLMSRLGDLRGRKVVDLACGEGHFTRLLRKAGAGQVVGMDISERMIDLARQQEASDPLGIEYQVADARELVPQEDFDLAVSAWLLVYSRDQAELTQMCRGIASWLRPGGRFVTFTTNPEVYSFQPRADYRKYGFEVRLADRVAEGAPIVWTIRLEDSSLDIENYYLPISAYASAFEAAGFRNFGVHRPELAPHPDDDRLHWQAFLEQPPAILMECVKI
jgi:ubiquinone/menaquinone biosynthesis C-methylase UbiE